eukprot:TRINITY_DN106610_c0_g1_i1.p1 TRINITY_DN106610_c0_g1~~TRINITY_DN106610_c0_g1_i1.p1  ORF type:complete len:829 (+),score=157.64 TRINITY_DN106610_c0_g1_i1:27-2513(+)
MEDEISGVIRQFQRLDADGSGFLDRTEFESIFSAMGVKQGEMDLLFHEADANKDGKIDIHEFAAFIFDTPHKSLPALTPLTADDVERCKELMKGVKLLETLGEKEICELANQVEVRCFKSGDQIITQGEEGLDCFFVDSGKAYAQIKVGDEYKEVQQYEAGHFFGERALLRSEPRAANVIARTELRLFRVSREIFVAVINDRNMKEHLVKNCKLFENMTDEQVAKIAGAFQRQLFKSGDKIVVQGEEGHSFYLLEAGECKASITTAAGTQEVKEYAAGDLFGEKALLENAPRVATVTAMTDVVTLVLSRDVFEAKLGKLSQLTAECYLADPRKLVSDFYLPGDRRGPAGSALAKGLEADKDTPTQWFVVYRPCSRDAIAKMLGKVGVGKGLNVKGKSAKKNRLSGFVPFLQISDNSHKMAVEKSPSNARTMIFYRNSTSRDAALEELKHVLEEGNLKIDDPQIRLLDTYPDSPGLDVPEPLMKEVYIMKPDISPMVGWETGRASEPAFMDMNLHAVRGDGAPKVVLYQFDVSDPMNPLGLLVAYAEQAVKPVVSDFDIFTVGSKGMKYADLPDKQRDLVDWELQNAQKVLSEPCSKSWTSRWLDVLTEEAAKGFHPDIPKFGFGDPVSVAIVEDVVKVTAPCGAVRHGAECFNFGFPQELDDDFLVVWDGYSEPPWRNLNEAELRAFLLERTTEGYIFPLNPVWPIRDPGWYDILQALRSTEEGREVLKCWLSDVNLQTIERVHKECPSGFVKVHGNKRSFTTANAQDATGEELADLVRNEVRKVVRARWARIRGMIHWAARLEIIRRKKAAELPAEDSRPEENGYRA